MRGSLLSGIALAAVVLGAVQSQVPSALSGHLQALHDAEAFSATLSVQPIGGAPSEIRVAFGKPNLYRIDTAEGFVVCDGKSVFAYSKATNTYTEEPASPGSEVARARADETWVWACFFSKEGLQGVRSAQPGAKRNLRGNQVTELAVTFENGAATVYLDAKLGVARGFALKRGSTDLLVLAKEIQVSKEPLPGATFQFVVPQGATKAVALAKPTASFAEVRSIFSRSCMPCHSSQVRSSSLDLSTHAGVTGKPGVVVSGDPSASRLMQAITGPSPRMPQGRAPLTTQEVDTIAAWIAAGAAAN